MIAKAMETKERQLRQSRCCWKTTEHSSVTRSNASPGCGARLKAQGCHLLRLRAVKEAKISSPTETERCIESLIAVFQRYAGRDGNSCKLSKTEFLTFMNTELAAFTKKDPGVLDRMMKKLDLNSDGQLDFQEFLNLIGGLAIACHDSFVKATHFQK
ncbi:hypothetical protein CB1_000306022 [Camelus ferus]|nr:hypothetical protein CB1_000306022 [Camelus ferus]